MKRANWDMTNAIQSKGQSPNGPHAPSFIHRGGRADLASPCSLFFLAICCIGIFSMLIPHSLEAAPITCPAGQDLFVVYCYGAASTGLVKADFTLAYSTYSLAAGPGVAVATTNILAEEGDPGCYQFSCLYNNPYSLYYLSAKITATGLERDGFIPMFGAAQPIVWSSSISISPTSYTYYRNDRSPDVIQKVECLPADPTGATVSFSMQKQGVTSTLKVNKQAGSVVAGSIVATTCQGQTAYNAWVAYPWGATDLDMSDCDTCTRALYTGQFEIDPLASGKLSLPRITITVYPDLDDN